MFGLHEVARVSLVRDVDRWHREVEALGHRSPGVLIRASDMWREHGFGERELITRLVECMAHNSTDGSHLDLLDMVMYAAWPKSGDGLVDIVMGVCVALLPLPTGIQEQRMVLAALKRLGASGLRDSMADMLEARERHDAARTLRRGIHALGLAATASGILPNTCKLHAYLLRDWAGPLVQELASASLPDTTSGVTSDTGLPLA